VLDLALVHSSVVGVLIAVSWAYLLQEQLDPRNECPAPGCWTVVVVLGVNAMLGVIYVPWFALALVRRLSRRDTIIAARLQRLATDAAGACWSVGVSGFLYALIKQLEFAASGGDPESFVRPASRAGDTAARRHLAHHRVPVLSACAGVAVGAAVLSVLMSTLATRRLYSKPLETGPLCVEVCLLLRSQLSYATAYAASAFFGLVLFAPFELGFGNTAGRFVVAIARAGLFVLGGHRLARSIGAPPADEADAIALAASSVKACTKQLTFSGLAVVASIGAHDAVAYFVQVVLPINTWRQIALLFFYAFALLAAVLARRATMMSTTTTTTTGGRRAGPDDDDDDAVVVVDEGASFWGQAARPAGQSSSRGRDFFVWKDPVNDEAFCRIFEKWLVAFAFWLPYKLFFVEVWDLAGPGGKLGIDVARGVHSQPLRFLASVALHALLLAWQLGLACAVIALFAFLTALPHLLRSSRAGETVCCGLCGGRRTTTTPRSSKFSSLFAASASLDRRHRPAIPQRHRPPAAAVAETGEDPSSVGVVGPAAEPAEAHGLPRVGSELELPSMHHHRSGAKDDDEEDPSAGAPGETAAVWNPLLARAAHNNNTPN